MAKHTTITIETSSLLIVRGGTSCRAWCPQCGTEQEMLALATIEVLSTLDQLALHRWLDSTDVHQFETAGGASLICLNSLLSRVKHPQPANCGTPRLPKPEQERT